ncbi:hypothetical protein CEQ15_17545 [Chryseobacterium indologenes]|nr:hypothetical protein CEQ15_17545 [Chryseobacterium indologenes]
MLSFLTWPLFISNIQLVYNHLFFSVSLRHLKLKKYEKSKKVKQKQAKGNFRRNKLSIPGRMFLCMQ